MTLKPFILAVMSDGQARTSYEICALLYPPQSDGAAWFKVAGACDWLVQHGQLQAAGKIEHRTLYIKH